MKGKVSSAGSESGLDTDSI